MFSFLSDEFGNMFSICFKIIFIFSIMIIVKANYNK